jgi:hypothetical protein
MIPIVCWAICVVHDANKMLNDAHSVLFSLGLMSYSSYKNNFKYENHREKDLKFFNS